MSIFSDYNDWYKTASPKVIAMIIDRGDMSPANRLTLTDRPFIDTDYSAIYPAPYSCIVSRIRSTENRKSTSFDAITILNDGRYDDILSSHKIIGQTFEIKIGDRNFSLIEKSLPNKFITIMRGEIRGVLFSSKTEITLKIIPMTGNYNNTIGSYDLPIGFGHCRYVPVSLVDSASREYRYNSIPEMWNTSGSEVPVVYDRGVSLTDGVDFTKNLGTISSPSPKYEGSFDLAAKADGRICSEVKTIPPGYSFSYSRPDTWGIWALGKRVARDYLMTDDFDLNLDGELNVSSKFSAASDEYMLAGMSFNIARDKYLVMGSDAIAHQYSVTGGDVANATDDSISRDFSALPASNPIADGAIDFMHGVYYQGAGEGVYVLHKTGGGDTLISSFGYTVADNLSTAGGTSISVIINSSLTANATGFCSNDLFTKLFVAQDDGNVLAFTLSTAGGVHTRSLDAVINLSRYDIFDKIKFSEDGLKFFGYSSSSKLVHQFTVADAYDITSYRYDHAVFSDQVPIDSGSFEVDTSNGYIYVANEITERIQQFDLVDGGLKRSFFCSNVGAPEIEYEGGVFYNSPTSVSSVMSDISGSLNCDFTINRLGEACFSRLVSPDYTLPDDQVLHVINKPDIFGVEDNIITHKAVEPPAEKVVMSYDHNYSVHSPEDTASSLTEAVEITFERRDAYVQSLNSIAAIGNDIPQDIVIKSFLNDESDAQAVADNEASTWDKNRFIFEVSCKYSIGTPLDDFGIGSIVQLNVDHPAFSSGDQMQVIGVDANWTDEEYRLTLFK